MQALRPVRADDDRRRRRPRPLDLHRVRGRRSDFTPEHAGRNIAWGVREHGMGAAVNGIALHGGIVKPFCSTFFVFTDYMRPPIRLSALMKLDVVWIFSHDSVAVGEDGPTHQPVEHLAAMRAIPKLTVIRPADANEASEAWALILESARPGLPRRSRARTSRRSTAAYSRRRPGLRRGRLRARRRRLARRGARRDRRRGRRRRSARATCSPRRASRRGSSRCRAGSSSRQQDADYRDEVLPAGVPKISVEAGDDVRLVALGRRVDRDRHASAPRARATRCSRTSGSAREAVAERVQELVAELARHVGEGHASASPRPSRSRRRSASSSTSSGRPRRSARRSPPAASASSASARSRTRARSPGPGSRSPASGTT